MKHLSLITSLSLALTATSAVAMDGDMQEALDLCLDISLSMAARGAGFEAAGWTRTEDRAAADAALAHALTISFLRPQEPDTWADNQSRSAETAVSLRDGRGFDGTQVLTRAGETVIIEATARGLASCLYVGPAQTLAPVADAVGAQVVTDFGAQSFVQGRAPSATVIAYSMAEDAMAGFPEPLTFGATFTTILDRRGEQ